MSTTKTTATATAAEQSRERLATALAAEAAAQADHAAALQAVEDMEERIVAGDVTLTSAEMLETEAGPRLTEPRLAAATSRRKAAEKTLISTSTDLAVALQRATADALGLPVQTGYERPCAPDELPAAFLTQSKAATGDTSTGVLSGELALTYFRTTQHRSVDTVALLAALSNSGTQATISAGVTTNSGGVVQEVYRVRVASAAPALPVIAGGPGRRALDAAGHLVADAVQDHHATMMDAQDVPLRTSASGLFGGSRSLGFQAVHRVSCATGHPTVTEDTTTGRDRHVTVLVQAQARIRPGITPKPNVYASLPELVSSTVGTFVPGIGRVVAASVVDTNAPEDVDGLDARVRLTLASRLPEGASRPTATSVPAQRDAAPTKAPATRRRSTPDPTDVDQHGRTPGSHPGARK